MKPKYSITLFSKVLIAQIVLNLSGFIIGGILYLNNENKKWNQLIYNNVKLEGIDLGGKSLEDAREIVNSKYKNIILKNKLNVNVKNKLYSLDFSELLKPYNFDNDVEKAFNFGKNLGFFDRHKYINTKIGKSFEMNISLNESSIENFINSIEKDSYIDPTNASIHISSEGEIAVKSDLNGYRVDKEELENSVKDIVNNSLNENVYLDAPIKEIQAEVRQNKYLAINSRISTFSTNFETSTLNRINNIEVCLKAINGIVLMPGEVFSFNDVVGERTKEQGYMEAPILNGNSLETGLGGGICQVSTTLYNAILKTGIDSIESTRHSMPSTYVGLGFDATINWKNIDFKFKNTLDYPIYIEGHTQDRNLYINIFSNSELNNKTYKLENVINKTNYGYKVDVIRKTYENGVMINTELISTDQYLNLDMQFINSFKY